MISLWEALEETNISVEFIKAVKSLYAQQQKLKLEKLTTRFNSINGLKQGRCVSPTLFKI